MATNDNLRAQLVDRDATIQKMAREAEAARKAHLAEKEQMNLKYEAKVRELMQSLTDLRTEKDSEIRGL